jgi:hypothetical protein
MIPIFLDLSRFVGVNEALVEEKQRRHLGRDFDNLSELSTTSTCQAKTGFTNGVIGRTLEKDENRPTTMIIQDVAPGL